MVNEIYGAREKKHEVNNQTTKSFSHALTFWYKNKKAKKPETKVIHSQKVELILQSSSSAIGGVRARIKRGIKSMYDRYFKLVQGCSRHNPAEAVLVKLPLLHSVQ